MGFDYVHLDNLVTLHAKECVNFAKENSLACLDLNLIMQDKDDEYKSLLADGLHFSKKGGELIFNELKPLLEKNILKDARLQYPFFLDIDYNNPVLKQ